MRTTDPDWNIVVFGRNEAATLQPCLEAIARAVGTRHARVDVLLNGCTDGSAAVARRVAATLPVPVQVWEIELADKANAWNQYVHGIRRQARVHCFVDAYASVAPDAFTALDAALAASPQAQAAAAVPSSGRSAAATRAAMLAAPALHGSLHALRGSFVERIRAGGLLLPVGLYRGDGLIGSMAMHDLDAATNPWNPRNIVVVPEASWTVRALSPWRPADLRRWWNRRIQQARGRLEDAALREGIYQGGFGRLPRDADEMLRGWMARHPLEVPTDGFTRRALRRMQRRGQPAREALLPKLYGVRAAVRAG